MELLLLKLVAISRPIGSVRYAARAFDVIGLGLFGLLILGGLISLALRKSLRMSAVDWTIVAFALWVLCGYVIYFDVAHIGDAAKLLVPMFGYTLVKNVIRDRNEYVRMLFWMIIGFSIPTVLSAALIAVGSNQAIQYVSYWTNLARWQGAYEGSHNLGQSMTLFLITIVIYWTLRKISNRGNSSFSERFSNLFLVALASVALYCLYMSQVRTAIAGLLIFVSFYLYHYNKRLLAMGAGAAALVAIVTFSYWAPAIVPELSIEKRGIELDAGDLGSGRGRIWANDIAVFSELPIDQKLAGMGIGNRQTWEPGVPLVDDPSDTTRGHNDWLEMLTQTGLVGFGLFVVLQTLLFRAAMRLDREQRYAFLAMVIAVDVMMFFSNSYAWRIQVSQLYYIMLAYIELQPRNEIADAQAARTFPNIGTGSTRRLRDDRIHAKTL